MALSLSVMRSYRLSSGGGWVSLSGFLQSSFFHPGIKFPAYLNTPLCLLLLAWCSPWISHVYARCVPGACMCYSVEICLLRNLFVADVPTSELDSISSGLIVIFITGSQFLFMGWSTWDSDQSPVNMKCVRFPYCMLYRCFNSLFTWLIRDVALSILNVSMFAVMSLQHNWKAVVIDLTGPGKLSGRNSIKLLACEKKKKKKSI